MVKYKLNYKNLKEKNGIKNPKNSKKCEKKTKKSNKFMKDFDVVTMFTPYNGDGVLYYSQL